MDGLYNKHEVLHGIITMLDGLTVTGQRNITLLGSVFQMLTALQKGLKEEDEAKNKIIETLKEQLKRATTPEPDEPGGDVVGGEQYNFNFGGAANDRNMV